MCQSSTKNMCSSGCWCKFHRKMQSRNHTGWTMTQYPPQHLHISNDNRPQWQNWVMSNTICEFQPIRISAPPKDQVIAFAEKDYTKDEIGSMKEIEYIQPHNWIPERKWNSQKKHPIWKPLYSSWWFSQIPSRSPSTEKSSTGIQRHHSTNKSGSKVFAGGGGGVKVVNSSKEVCPDFVIEVECTQEAMLL